MKKIESSLLNMVLSLFLICAVMSAALASVYMFTKEPIANADKKKINDAIGLVLPVFDNSPAEESFKVGFTQNINGANSADTLVLYPAYKDGKLIGTAISSYTYKGYSGYISVMVGITAEGTIFNTKVMEQKETPGLGTKMSDAKFHDQFNGKNPEEFNLQVKKDGGDVDAITAATISSRAYCDALNRALHAYKSNMASTAMSDTAKSIQLNEGGTE